MDEEPCARLVDAQDELRRQQADRVLNPLHREEDGVACKVYEASALASCLVLCKKSLLHMLEHVTAAMRMGVAKWQGSWVLHISLPSRKCRDTC